MHGASPQSRSLMSEANGWFNRSIDLRDTQTLHLRPIQCIVEISSRYGAEVRAIKDHLDLNAKSITDMIELAAYLGNKVPHDEKGFHFLAQGTDAVDALNALEVLVGRNFRPA
jgi:phosphotransferase system HPr-like phosphotransfer protein